jgi:hypothetical protein
LRLLVADPPSKHNCTSSTTILFDSCPCSCLYLFVSICVCVCICICICIYIYIGVYVCFALLLPCSVHQCESVVLPSCRNLFHSTRKCGSTPPLRTRRMSLPIRTHRPAGTSSPSCRCGPPCPQVLLILLRCLKFALRLCRSTRRSMRHRPRIQAGRVALPTPSLHRPYLTVSSSIQVR